MERNQAAEQIADAVYLLATSEGPLARRLHLVAPIILEASDQGAPADLRPELRLLQDCIRRLELSTRPITARRLEIIEDASLLLRLCFALVSRTGKLQDISSRLGSGLDTLNFGNSYTTTQTETL